MRFGSGSIADTGNYSLWPIFMALDLPVPDSIEAQSSSSAEIKDQVSGVTMNDFAFPFNEDHCAPALLRVFIFHRRQ